MFLFTRKGVVFKNFGLCFESGEAFVGGLVEMIDIDRGFGVGEVVIFCFGSDGLMIEADFFGGLGKRGVVVFALSWTTWV